MTTAVKMPKLGMSMREGTVVEWRVSLGGAVDKGEILLIIESEKAEVEIEATAAGVLRHVYVEPGSVVPCGTLLAALTADMDEPFDAQEFHEANDTPEAVVAAMPASPAARGPATGPAETRAGQRRPVAPAARARARELGIDVAVVVGSGPGGRVTRADVDACAAARAELVEARDGIHLQAPTAGQGDPVVLLPGFGTDVSSFAPQANALMEHFRVHAVNPRGIGLSDRGPSDVVDPRIVAEDVASLIDSPTHVVGASFGAATALELARARPELVRSLTLITPCMTATPRLLAVLASWQRLIAEASPELVATAMLPWLFSGEFLADAKRAARTARGFAAMTASTPADVLARYLEGLRRWGAEKHDLDELLAHGKTLVIAAEQDLLTPLSPPVLAGARVEVVAGAGHAVCLEAPETVTRLILDHLG